MLFGIVLTAILLLLPHPIQAIYDPHSVPNNKYGMHIADTNDLIDVAPVINSNHGDWGYVTLVIPDSDKNTDKWQNIFNTFRRLHLIPIVRIATHVEKDAWVKPTDTTVDDWVTFLNSLNWPIENRYVVLFNEPNHAKEWGNSLNPEEVAQLVDTYATALKTSNEDYFILPPALDVSAANTNESMDAAEFLSRMYREKPDMFDRIDGWNSHSYPNPAFSGSPFATGRGTLRSYQWEEAYLASLGFTKRLPVFITETGWQHKDGKQLDGSLLPTDTVASYTKTALDSVWNDPSIVAITPFVYSYQDIPFDHFSWKKLGTSDLYDNALVYQQQGKTKGEPKQHQLYETESSLLPLSLVSGSSYEFTTTIKNRGQNILDTREGYHLEAIDTVHTIQFSQEYAVPYLEPGEQGEIRVSIQTPMDATTMHIFISLGKRNDMTTIEEKYIRIVAPPAMDITTTVGFNSHKTEDRAKILVYDMKDRLIHEYDELSINAGTIHVSELRNVVPGKPYRVVVIIPGCLPRQTIIPLKRDTTAIELKRFLPLDFDEDGAFTEQDVVRILREPPFSLWRRLF